ncbi:MAG: hypothetical protein AAGA48_22635 [Myxococcota bacterium]
MVTTWFIATVTFANPGALLAPSPRELQAAEAELSERVLRAEAIGRAASRLQNTAARAEDPCEGGLITRARAFASAWRDAAQRARVQGERTQRMASSPTLAPIMNDERKARVDDLAKRAEQQAQSWFEFDRLEERSKVQCEDGVKPARGLPSPTPIPRGDEGRPVAIWVLQGSLCPGPRRVRGVAVVSGPVCVDTDPGCGCEPAEVLPGAVLAP